MKQATFLFFILLFVISLPFSAQTPQSQVPLADPYILLDGDTYYAYGTHAADGIECWRSKDLQYWNYVGLALEKKNTTEQQWFWAPEVYYKNGKYYMYYSANEHLFVATANSPRGPFKQVGSYMMEPLIGDEKCIDSSVYFDEDGTPYCFFVRFTDGNCIWQCQLQDDYITPVEGTLKKCINVTESWESKLGRVCEGPFVLRNKRVFFLTYSANDYRSQDYGVGYARGTKPNSTWTKNPKPILQRAQGLVGTGHHSFFTDKEGRLRIVFHAHNSTEEVQPRLMYIGSAEISSSTLRITDDPFIAPQKVGTGVGAPAATPKLPPLTYDLLGRPTAFGPIGLFVAQGRKILRN